MYREEANKRRKKIAELLKEGEMLILFGGNDELGVDASPTREKMDENFYYLTGMSIPEGVLLIGHLMGRIQEFLFIRRRTENEAFYLGMALDPEYYSERTGIQAVLYSDEFEDMIDNFAMRTELKKVFFASSFEKMSKYPRYENLLADRLQRAYPRIQVGSLTAVLKQMRLVKSPLEREQIQKAIDITGDALTEAVKQLKPGIHDYQMQSILEHEIKMRGGRGEENVLALFGKDTTIMHNFNPNATAADGDLFLTDICTFYNDYCGDISRTYPVNGKFTEEQAHWYNVVLRAQEMTIASMAPGKLASECGVEATLYMEEELRKAGYLAEGETIKMMLGQCRTNYATPGMVNHSIGLSCHELWGSGGNRLEPGMIFAIEPGIYLGEKAMGIRIEDDVLITENGVEVLSEGIPKTIEEIEAMMQK